MGHRTAKRVPLDFDWPIGKVWYGYFVSLCIEDAYGEEDACEYCRKFAIMKGIEIASYDCPKPLEILEPPRGEGWQLWETTSEGSPTSPVFKTAEELAIWCEINATVFAGDKASKENWLKMFNDIEGMSYTTLGVAKAGYIGSVINEPKDTGGD